MKTKTENFLRELDTEIDVLNYVNIEDIDYEDAFDSIRNMIEENNGFDVEIIYFSRAIAFLAENDPSLQECLEIASEYGYEAYNLNSEILATLLASQNARVKFNELEDEINSFFSELKEEEEEE